MTVVIRAEVTFAIAASFASRNVFSRVITKLLTKRPLGTMKNTVFLVAQQFQKRRRSR